MPDKQCLLVVIGSAVLALSACADKSPAAGPAGSAAKAPGGPATAPAVASAARAPGGPATAPVAAPAAGAAPSSMDIAPMVEVPGGEFLMGSKPDEGDKGDDEERPQRRVHVKTFHIDKLEVTVEQYRLCVAMRTCTPPDTKKDCNWMVADRDKHPVNCVDHGQAEAYCRWAAKRLPTEAEWEKAARGADGRQYPWGNDLPTCDRAVSHSNVGWGCGRLSTWPVGSKPSGASPYGALDMAGNVREWVADRFQESYYKDAPARDPVGPSTGEDRVVRGGGWNLFPVQLRAAHRSGVRPGQRYPYVGFRCAR